MFRQLWNERSRSGVKWVLHLGTLRSIQMHCLGSLLPGNGHPGGGQILQWEECSWSTPLTIQMAEGFAPEGKIGAKQRFQWAKLSLLWDSSRLASYTCLYMPDVCSLRLPQGHSKWYVWPMCLCKKKKKIN